MNFTIDYKSLDISYAVAAAVVAAAAVAAATVAAVELLMTFVKNCKAVRRLTLIIWQSFQLV